MRSQLHPQRRIAALAESQHGAVSREQLVALGVGGSAIDNRVADGRLHVRHRGVYAVGHSILTREGEFMAAVLACGRGAVLSHRSAGQLRGFPLDGCGSRRRVGGRAQDPAARRDQGAPAAADGG
jgi:hypothetical protein